MDAWEPERPSASKSAFARGFACRHVQDSANPRASPGGKLELGEDPAECVVREISEETGWQITAGPLLDCWQYHIGEGRDVVVVTYGCHVLSTEAPVVSDEHQRIGVFGPGDVPYLPMPDGYKRSISAWFARIDGQAEP